MSESIDKTVNAFPIPGLKDDPEFNGLTKLEWFATKALPIMYEEAESGTHFKDIAADAFELAEAMLAESEKRK